MAEKRFRSWVDLTLFYQDPGRTSVWQDMRDQAENEVLAIKTESKKLIDEAEKRAVFAETTLKALKLELDEKSSSLLSEQASKEIALLDIKKIKEERNLLLERFKSLEDRYTEMQALNSQHLTDLSNTHKNEVIRLKDAVDLLQANADQLIQTVKENSEHQRQQDMLAIDSLKVENKKLKDTIEKLQTQLHEKGISIKNLEADLRVKLVEREEALKQSKVLNDKWTCFNNKIFVSDDFLEQLYKVPKLESIYDNFNHMIESSMKNNFINYFEKVDLSKFAKLYKDKRNQKDE